MAVVGVSGVILGVSRGVCGVRAREKIAVSDEVVLSVGRR